MCLAGPRWRPNREIAWHTERLLPVHHVRYTNSKRSPSSNAINPVFMGFQMQFFSILRFFWSILVESRVHLRTSSSKTQMLLLEETIFHKY